MVLARVSPHFWWNVSVLIMVKNPNLNLLFIQLRKFQLPLLNHTTQFLQHTQHSNIRIVLLWLIMVCRYKFYLDSILIWEIFRGYLWYLSSLFKCWTTNLSKFKSFNRTNCFINNSITSFWWCIKCWFKWISNKSCSLSTYTFSTCYLCTNL